MRSGISSARGRAFHCLLALGRPITFRCGAKCHSLDSFWIKLTWGKTGAATGVLGREDTVSFSGAIDIQFTICIYTYIYITYIYILLCGF